MSNGHPVIDTPDTPDETIWHRERGRLRAQGHRTDDDGMCTLLVIHETDGRWAIHGLGVPGVRLTNDVMITVAESILKKARR